MHNYSLKDLAGMINQANRHRVEAYVRAMEQTITAESVVLEIGTGIGFFAVIACRMGARHVFAIEPNPLVQIGRELARANAVADRITFIQGLSTRVSLPEQADIIVSDLGGALPWLPGHLEAIADARTRFLKPGGILIRRRDSVWAAVVHVPELYARRIATWNQPYYTIETEPLRIREINRFRKCALTSKQLITPAVCWTEVDYATATETGAKGAITWVMEHAETGHGVCLWYESELVPGVRLSNNPRDPKIPAYGQVFFPWERPVELSPGDTVNMTIEVIRVESGYEWVWRTRIKTSREKDRAAFTQSSFLADVLPSGMDHHRKSPDPPVLKENGRVDRFILGRIDGRTPSSHIAEAVMEKFPEKFTTRRMALERIGDLARRYCAM